MPTIADDIYSLGVLLDELLQHMTAIPADLRAIVGRACAADAGARYPTVAALREDLADWLNGLPVRAHRATWRYVLRKRLGGVAVLFVRRAYEEMHCIQSSHDSRTLTTQRQSPKSASRRALELGEGWLPSIRTQIRDKRRYQR